jgi:hypothetical protein
MAALSPPVSVRVLLMADDLNADAAAIDRVAEHADPGDAEKLLALGRRLRRHADALTAVAWEIDRGAEA